LNLERAQVVWDEGVPYQQSAPVPVLHLDVYDILNVCVERPNDVIDNARRLISLPLDGLRAMLKSLVELERNPPPVVARPASTAVVRQYPAGPSERRRKRARHT
jgi:hypothetical protein